MSDQQEMPQTPRLPGRFVWREIMTPDVEKTKSFYTGLVGWSYETVSMMEGMQYTIIQSGEYQLGGVFPLEWVKMEVPPHWLLYVSTEDTDAAYQAALDNGGSSIKEPFDVPMVGRIALFSDPTGGVIAAFHGANGDAPQAETPVPGLFCWDQINTTNTDEAREFYKKVFPWGEQPFEPDPSAPNKIFTAQGRPVAGVNPAPEGVPTHWLTFIQVQDLAQARAKVKELGGQIHLEEMEIPTFGKICVIADNVGASVGLFQQQS